MLSAIFERFTDRARRVIILAQDEALRLNHDFIGTEHMLLGLLAEGRGVAAQALGQLGVTLDDARQRVEETIGLSGIPPIGNPPFTPRTKKALELSFAEALQLGHNYIGTEHVLLGLVREGEGVGAQILISLGVNLPQVRQTVVELLAGRPESPVRVRSQVEVTQTLRSHLAEQRGAGVGFAKSTGPSPAQVVRCSFCGRHPPGSGRLVQGGRAFICEHCIKAWSERLATEEDEGRSDPSTAHLYDSDEDDEEDSDG